MKTESDLIIESIIRNIEHEQFSESMNANYYNDNIDREDMTLAGHQWPEVDLDRYPRQSSLDWHDLNKILSKGAYHTITYAPYHYDKTRKIIDPARKGETYIDKNGKTQKYKKTQYWYADRPNKDPYWHNTPREEVDVSYQRNDFDASDETYTYYVTRNWKQFQNNSDIAIATGWTPPKEDNSMFSKDNNGYITVWKFGTKSEADELADRETEIKNYIGDHRSSLANAQITHGRDSFDVHAKRKNNSNVRKGPADYSTGKGGEFGSTIDKETGVPYGLKSGFRSLVISRIVAIDGKPIH